MFERIAQPDGGRKVADPAVRCPANDPVSTSDRVPADDLTEMLAALRPEDAPDTPPMTPANCAPSGWLALELDMEAVEPASMSDAQLIDALIGWDRLASWAAARQFRVLGEFDRRRPDEDAQAIKAEAVCTGSELATDEVGLALRISRGAARARLSRAVALTEVLTNTLDLLEQGRLDAVKARVICDAVAFRTPQVAAKVESRVLPAAPNQTVGQLRAALARALIEVDPVGAGERHRAARSQRQVRLTEQDDGMASLWALLAAPDAVASYEWLTRLARSLGKDDPRPMDARRADLLVDLLTGRLELHDDPTSDSTDDPTVDPAVDPTVDLTGDLTGDPTGDPTGGSTDDPTGTAPASAVSTNSGASSEGASSGAAPSGAAPSGAAPSTSATTRESGHEPTAPCVEVERAPVTERSPAAEGAPVPAGDTVDSRSTLVSDPIADPDSRSAGAGEREPGPGDARSSVAAESTTDQADADSASEYAGLTAPDSVPEAECGPPGRGARRCAQGGCGARRCDRRGCGPRPAGAGKPLVHVIVPYSTLLGVDDQPCELAGYGPIPAELAREIAADAVWKRLVTDPLSGALLDYGRTTYRPPVALSDFVRARDMRCRSPICRRQAGNCELDHTTAWADGGRTAEDNLWAGCVHDHHLKHRPGWRVRQCPDGKIEWTTPTGHTYRSDPHDYRPPDDRDPPVLRRSAPRDPVPEQLTPAPKAKPDRGRKGRRGWVHRHLDNAAMFETGGSRPRDDGGEAGDPAPF